MAILLVTSEPGHLGRSKTQYVLSQLLDSLGYFYVFEERFVETAPSLEGAKQSFFQLYHGPPSKADTKASIIIPVQDDRPIEELIRWLGKPHDEQYVAQQQGQDVQWHCSYDLIRAAFYLLSRQEELGSANVDGMGRFVASESVLARLGLLERPVLNEALNALDRTIQTAAAVRPGLLLKKAIWPHPYQYACSMTHDVDELGYRDPRFGLACLGQFLRTGRPHALKKGAGTIAQWGVNKASGRAYARDFLNDWMDFERDLGMRSTFYFVSANRKKSSYDPNYDVAEPTLASKLRRLLEQGWEIGVHGSFDSYDRAEYLAEERERLKAVIESDVIGVRQHYLRFRAPDSWTAQQSAGFGYDGTLGLRDRHGLRVGLATPFEPYDWKNKRSYDLLELPLSAMDGVLFWRHQLLPDQVFQRVKDQIEAVKSSGGHWVALWHHNARDLKRRPGWWSVYCEFAAELAGDDSCFVATMAEIHDWWRARQKMTVKSIGRDGEQTVVIVSSPNHLAFSLRIDAFGPDVELLSTTDQYREVPASRPTMGHAAIALRPAAAGEDIVIRLTG